MSFGNIITYPFAWLLLFLYNIVQNYGLAIILFSLVIKVVLLPFNAKSKKGTMKTGRLSPELADLQKRYGNNKAKLNEETQKLYKEHNVKPLGGCVWQILPLAIMLILYSAIRLPLTHMMHLSADEITAVTGVLEGLGLTVSTGTYAEVGIANQIFNNFDAVKAVVPGVIRLNFSFLGLDLSATPGFGWFTNFTYQSFGLFLIPLISAGLAWLSSKLTSALQPPAMNEMAGQMKTMLIMMPLMSLWIGFIMPGSMGIYWIANSVFSMIQEVILTKHYNKVLDAEDAERIAKKKAAEAEREKKRAEYERLKAQNATTRNANTSKKKVQKAERLTAAQQAAEYEKKKLAEKGLPVPEKKKDDRPFARGRGYDPNRYAQAEAEIERKRALEQAELSEEEKKLAAEAAEEEAKRLDEEAFEKFLETGKVEAPETDSDSDPWSDREDAGDPWDKK